MATAVIMPRQGNTVESCMVSKWHKKKGDKVNVGDILFTYETDKATFDEEAKDEGNILEIFHFEGDDVPVLENMCIIGTPGEDISAFLTQDKVEDKKTETTAPEKIVSVNVQNVQVERNMTDEHIKISPRAKNLAQKTGVDITYANASGPSGRIIEQDIQALVKEGVKVVPAAKDIYKKDEQYEATGIGGRITVSDVLDKKAASEVVKVVSDETEYEDEKLTNIRKVIARTMHKSLSEMAQLTLNMSFDATSIQNFRADIKAQGQKLGLENITLNDIVVYATAKTLVSHKDLNAHFIDDTLRRFNTVHMGVAIDTKRGLMVPTVFNAEQKTLNEISKQVKEMAELAKAGNINPDLLTGGTFTITNLGSLGVESFTPVINPPQTAILGVCGLSTKVKEKEGVLTAYQAMSLSLTIDHRVVDGAPAARFLKDLCTNLENFEMLLAK